MRAVKNSPDQLMNMRNASQRCARDDVAQPGVWRVAAPREHNAAQGLYREEDVDVNREKFLKLADAALYQATITGRNQAMGLPDNQIEIKYFGAMLTIN